MGLDNRNWPEREYNGRGFGYDLPGGFTTPETVTVYAPPDGGLFRRESELNTLFVQDRIDIGDKWVVTAGLRLEGQSMDNNIGQQVNDYDELAPRLSVVYDVNADGRLLIRGTAGRYLNLFNMSLTQNFDQGSNGTNTRQVFNWNPATQAYDVLNSSIVASAGREATRNLVPEYSDAYTPRRRLAVQPELGRQGHVQHERERQHLGHDHPVRRGRKAGLRTGKLDPGPRSTGCPPCTECRRACR